MEIMTSHYFLGILLGGEMKVKEKQLMYDELMVKESN